MQREQVKPVRGQMTKRDVELARVQQKANRQTERIEDLKVRLDGQRIAPEAWRVLVARAEREFQQKRGEANGEFTTSAAANTGKE